LPLVVSGADAEHETPVQPSSLAILGTGPSNEQLAQRGQNGSDTRR
jgi:hypothetical protein